MSGAQRAPALNAAGSAVKLTGPLVNVQSFHNVFRRGITEIDDLAYAAVASGGPIQPALDRLELYFKVIEIHARGENIWVFPVLEKVAPLVAYGYQADHDEIGELSATAAHWGPGPEPLVVARATAVMKAHMMLHLDKEEAQLYPLLEMHTSRAEQAHMVERIGAETPEELFPDAVAFVFGLADPEDRAVITRGWMEAFGTDGFAYTLPLIQQAVGEDWDDLVKRVPELR
jgi:hemerythrin-like domain-containing protein